MGGGVITGMLDYQGIWNANTNTPALASGVGTKNYYYVVSVAGNTNLDGVTDWGVMDWAIFNGTTWQKIDNTDAVISVNGKTGIVVVTKSDVGLGSVTDNAQIIKSIGTTKGDVIAFTGSATPVRLGVGANDTVLIADSGAGAGVKWGGVPMASSDTEILFDNSGVIDGIPRLHYDGTRIVLDGDTDGNILLSERVGTIAGAICNFSIGDNALEDLTSGDNNISIGEGSLQQLTAALRNIAIGCQTLPLITFTGNNDNVVIGHQAMVVRANTTKENVGVGTNALGVAGVTTAIQRSVGVGYHAGSKAGDDSTSIGADAGECQSSGIHANNDDFIAIGSQCAASIGLLTDSLLAGNNIGDTNALEISGCVLLGPNVHATNNTNLTNKLIIDNQDRGVNFASESLIYGDFNGTTTNQNLTLNSNLIVKHDLWFNTVGGGLNFAGISAQANAGATTISVQNQWEQVLTFGVDDASNMSVPSHGDDHITVNKTGVYTVAFNTSFSGGAGKTYEIEVKKNNGTASFANIHIERKIGSGGDIGSTASSGRIALTATDTVELWIRCTDVTTADATIRDANLNLVQVGA